MKNKSIYIVLSKTGTHFSNIISYLTKKEFAHASISLDDTFLNMYSFGRKVPELLFPAGFVKENLYSGVFSKFKDSKCLIYKIDVTNEQYEVVLREINTFSDNSNNLKYNLIGTLFAYFNKPLKTKNKYFCSQFVSEVLIKADVLSSDKLPELMRPMDLLDVENKELVYEGVIKESFLYNTYVKSTEPTDEPSFTMLWYMLCKVKSFYFNYK